MGSLKMQYPLHFKVASQHCNVSCKSGYNENTITLYWIAAALQRVVSWKTDLAEILLFAGAYSANIYKRNGYYKGGREGFWWIGKSTVQELASTGINDGTTAQWDKPQLVLVVQCRKGIPATVMNSFRILYIVHGRRCWELFGRALWALPK